MNFAGVRYETSLGFFVAISDPLGSAEPSPCMGDSPLKLQGWSGLVTYWKKIAIDH